MRAVGSAEMVHAGDAAAHAGHQVKLADGRQVYRSLTILLTRARRYWAVSMGQAPPRDRATMAADLYMKLCALADYMYFFQAFFHALGARDGQL
jgi:hypothetical protein